MMPSQPASISFPDSYATIPYEEIRVSHVPESISTVTPVVVVTLYRPKKYNAFTMTMMAELEEVFGLFDIDDRVKCIVVTGHGKMFCAGADLESGFKAGKEKVNEHRDSGGRVVLSIHRCRKPVIGALSGSAVGVGITMALPMAIRIAYRDAKIGFVFARRGLVMEACSSFFLPRLIGHSRALHLITTGVNYPASHPLLSNLFSEILDKPEQVLPRALEIAEDVARNTSTVSTALMREMMWRGPGSAESMHLLDSRIVYELFDSKDNREGVKAFLEKRPVNFTGTMEADAPAAYPWWDAVDIAGRAKASKSVKSSKL